ncbi:plasmid mobilization protein [Pseudomonas sp.]|uniref:plasmid mobilization protein n=1 Tax=Pseudomonas sp. TaxID=306 RepID=UPI003A979AFC
MGESTSRRVEPPIKVYCLPHERERILLNAQASGHSASRYLLLVGQGYEVSSILDYQYVEELARVNADQARLGNLLKLALTHYDHLPAYGQMQANRTLQTLVDEIRESQQSLRSTMAALVTPIAARSIRP